MFIYDQNWNIIDRYTLPTKLTTRIEVTPYLSWAGQIPYGSVYQVWSHPPGVSRSLVEQSTLQRTLATKYETLYLDQILQISNNLNTVYKIVLYTYDISGNYDFNSLLGLLNEDTANNNYETPYVKFTSAGWRDIKTPTYNSPYNERIVLSNISTNMDYVSISSRQTVSVNNKNGQTEYSPVRRADQDSSLWDDTNNGSRLRTLIGGRLESNFKLGKTGTLTIKHSILDDIKKLPISGPEEFITISTVAPNPIGFVPPSPEVTKTAAPTRTPTQTPIPLTTTPTQTPAPTSTPNRLVISPISNYVPGNATIYTPYKTSGAVCIFNEPDGSDYIRNQINDVKAYASASTSKIMGNCLVPKVTNSVGDGPYATIMAGIAEQPVYNFTIEYYFYLNSNKRTTIYSSDANYYDTALKLDRRTVWDLTYYNVSGDSSLKGLVSYTNYSYKVLDIVLQTGWYHFAVTHDGIDVRYFINGKQIGGKFNINFPIQQIIPRVVTYVDQLDALRITKESLYLVPFTTLPHM